MERRGGCRRYNREIGSVVCLREVVCMCVLRVGLGAGDESVVRSISRLYPTHLQLYTRFNHHHHHHLLNVLGVMSLTRMGSIANNYI